MKRFFGVVLALVLVLNLCPEIRAYAAENVDDSAVVEEILSETDSLEGDDEAEPEEEMHTVSGLVKGYEGTKPFSLVFGDVTVPVIDGKYEVSLPDGTYSIALEGATGYKFDEWWYEEYDRRITVWQQDKVVDVWLEPIFVEVSGKITGVPEELIEDFEGYVHLEMNPEYAAANYTPSFSFNLNVFVDYEDGVSLYYTSDAPIIPYGDYTLTFYDFDDVEMGTYAVSFSDDSTTFDIDVSEFFAEEPEEEGFVVSFAEFEGGKYVAYDRQNFDEAVVTDNATTALARNSETGEVDTTGDGQVNFTVVIEEGYSFEGIEITEGTSNYKNLKTISTEGNVFTFRITKIKGDLTVSVYTKKLDEQGAREKLIGELQAAVDACPKYFETYCTPETAAVLSALLETVNGFDYEVVSNEEIVAATENISAAIANLTYKTAEVPQVYISTENGDGNTIVKKTGYVNTDIVIVGTDGSVINQGGEIKVRGNSTAGAEKKAFNIKFSSKQDVLGMGKAKKWCLLANCYDASLMRNATAFAIAAEFGIPYTSENQYVELWVDGVFKGCYLLTEAVEEGKTRVDIDIDGDDFMLELEKSRVEEGTTYITNGNGLRFSFKEPEEPSEEKFASVQAVLDRITAVIDSGDYDAVSEAIDIESFAKFYVLNEYMRNYDFNFSSVYFFYKDGVLYAGPVWDFDLSSGNGRDGIYSYTLTDYSSASKANWYPYLLKYSEFQKVVEETFAEYSDYLESITAEGGFIDKTYADNKAVFERNFNEAGWIVSKRYSLNQMIPFATLEENIQFYKDWLTKRITWMKKYYASLIPSVWVYPAVVETDCVTISWREEEKADSYRVYRRSDETWVFLANVKSGNTYSDYSAEEGVDYYYDVVSVVNGTRGDLNCKGVPARIDTKTWIPSEIVSQPQNVVLREAGKTVEFTTEATGKGISYMWYVKTPDSDRFIKTGVSDTTYSRKIYAKNDGLQVYCRITDVYGNVLITDTATVTIQANEELRIVTDTADIVGANNGQKYTFTIDAKGDGVTYSWFYMLPETSGGDGKFHKAGCYDPGYTRTASEKTDGMQVYCIVTDVSGKKLIGRTATLKLKQYAPAVSYPDGLNIEVKSGKKAVFKVAVESEEEVSYSWFYMLPETSGGDGKFHKAGCYEPIYTRTASEKTNGMQAYCLISDANGNKIKSDVITLTVVK